MLDIRQLKNGLERHGARSRPTTPPLASLAGIDALTGAPSRGKLGTISASTKTENTRECRGGIRTMIHGVRVPNVRRQDFWERSGAARSAEVNSGISG
jgi:hypothetical protein